MQDRFLFISFEKKLPLPRHCSMNLAFCWWKHIHSADRLDLKTCGSQWLINQPNINYSMKARVNTVIYCHKSLLSKSFYIITDLYNSKLQVRKDVTVIQRQNGEHDTTACKQKLESIPWRYYAKDRTVAKHLNQIAWLVLLIWFLCFPGIWSRSASITSFWP